ncbi:MAG TPA: glycosyltransferase family 39 protein [Solirubrobacteraceae bacterium]|nr:glycosyltransferase family 39 protein [Solirubrobacteraceae bacterium]
MARLRTIPRWVLVLALVLAAGAAWRAHHAIDHGEFLSTDERAYAALGVSLSHGHYDPRGMNDPLHWPPGTPLLFAVARQLTGAADTPLDPPVAYAAQALVGVLLIVVVFVLVRLLAGPWPAVAAAGAVALYPPLAVITGDMVSEPLGALTIAVVMLALAWAWRAPSPWRFALAGAATGAAILVRADLLILPGVLAAVVALTLRRAGARRALTAAGAYLLAAVLTLAPWSVYATTKRSQFTPITSSSWSSLFVGTYLPGDGRIFGLREALGDEAREHNPNIREIKNRNLRTEWILDAVAARHPDVGRSEALKRETLRNLRRYALGRPLAFAGMQLSKLERMWIGYDRGTHHAERGWILAVHLLVSAAGLAGLLFGLWRTRHPALWAILATVLTVTAVNSFFVSEARHNVRLVPLLAAGGAAGVALALSGRERAERSGPPRARASADDPPPAGRPSDAAAVR